MRPGCGAVTGGLLGSAISVTRHAPTSALCADASPANPPQAAATSAIAQIFFMLSPPYGASRERPGFFELSAVTRNIIYVSILHPVPRHLLPLFHRFVSSPLLCATLRRRLHCASVSRVLDGAVFGCIRFCGALLCSPLSDST